MRLIARLVLSALAFTSVLPMITGINFHGSFWQALGLSIVFGLMLWIVDILAIAITTVAAVTTLGAALLFLVPMWLFGFWLLPAVALKMLSDVMPSTLSVTGWVPAILGGLVLMVISMITSASYPKNQQVQ